MVLIINEKIIRDQTGLLEEYITKGKVFIYPTDTVYGIGCDASNKESVERLKNIKKRLNKKKLSVIAPGKYWIEKNFNVEKEYLDLLPGPYTLIVEMDNQILPENVSKKTLGVRIPNHWISKAVETIGIPIITTSANISGEPTIQNIENAPDELISKVDLIIKGDVLKGKPSKVIDVKTGKILRK